MNRRSVAQVRRWAALNVVLALIAAIGAGIGAAQERGAQRAFVVTAQKYAFEPARLEVQQDDLVKVTLRTQDIPHTFSIDAYRISKRAAAGQAVSFEFRASKPGTFPIYCELRQDDGCRRMKGELVVTPR